MQRKSSGVLRDKDPRRLIYPNFCLDFLGLNNNYIANFLLNN